MANKFESEFFETVDDLLEAKDNAWRGVSDRKERLDLIRKFSNGLSMMTPEEAQASGRTEIVNHLTTYSKLSNQASMFESMVTGQKDLCEIIVDTDNPEQDMVLGERLTEAVNRGAFSRKGRFAQFWKKCAGEIVMSGGPPVSFGVKYGWLPDLELDIFFPKDTDLDSERMTYAFLPEEMTLADLEDLASEVEGMSSSSTDLENVREVIEVLKKRIGEQDRTSNEFGKEVTRSATDGGDGSHDTIDLWSYYELKTSDDGSRYVSRTVFTESLDADLPAQEHSTLNKERTESAYIISYIEKAYNNAEEWLQLICIDSEIGGVKNTDTLRGMAELIYPSSAEIEDLFNRLLEGDKVRAMPKMRLTENANPDDLAQWDIAADSFVPEGVEEMQFNQSSQHLQSPINYLQGNVSGITGAPVTNSGQGGELRQQAVERQEVSASIRSNRISEAYDRLDGILEIAVWRLLAGDTKASADGYQETKWVRDFLKKYEIDYKTLASRKNGQFEFLRVRAKRSIGNGDREHQLQTSDWLLNNIQSYPPASRPLILREATQLRTQNPDLADRLVKVPKNIINSQKLVAENEYDTIIRRAPLGQSISTNETDVHQEHIPVHLLDMQALLARHQYEPWTKLDALGFGGMIDHTGEHVQILLSNPASNYEGQQFVADFQALVQASRPVFQEVEEKEQGEQQEPLTAKEEADLMISMKKLELEYQKFGLQAGDLQNLQDIRESRARLSARNQYAREIAEDRRLDLQERSVNQQGRGQAASTLQKAKESQPNTTEE